MLRQTHTVYRSKHCWATIMLFAPEKNTTDLTTVTQARKHCVANI